MAIYRAFVPHEAALLTADPASNTNRFTSRFRRIEHDHIASDAVSVSASVEGQSDTVDRSRGQPLIVPFQSSVLTKDTIVEAAFLGGPRPALIFAGRQNIVHVHSFQEAESITCFSALADEKPAHSFLYFDSLVLS